MTINWGKLGLFAGGVLFGTAGIAILSSDDAKKAYTHCTAAVLRGRDAVMEKSSIIRENCEDIYADASDINEKRASDKAAKKLAEARAIVAAAEEADTAE